MSIHLCSVSRDMYHFLLSIRIDSCAAKLLHVVAYAYKYIGYVTSKRDIITAHKPHSPQCIWMIVWKDSLSHECSCYRDLKPLRESNKCILCIIPSSTMSC